MRAREPPKSEIVDLYSGRYNRIIEALTYLAILAAISFAALALLGFVMLAVSIPP